MAPVVDVRLRELDVGKWAGLTRDEILRRDPETLARFEAGDPDVCAGGGESRRAIRLRVASCVRQLIREHAGRSIALVAHLGVIRALRPGPDWELANAEWRCSAASALRVAEPADARP
jgi:broad specificity phosphatase PhoE